MTSHKSSLSPQPTDGDDPFEIYLKKVNAALHDENQCHLTEEELKQKSNTHKSRKKGKLEKEIIKKCDQCPYSTIRLCDFKRHLARHTVAGFACSECNRPFLTQGHLNGHKESIHGIKQASDKRVWKQCDVCIYKSRHPGDMTKHRKRHELSVADCKYCKRPFCHLRNLILHMQKDHRDKNEGMGTSRNTSGEMAFTFGNQSEHSDNTTSNLNVNAKINQVHSVNRSRKNRDNNCNKSKKKSRSAHRLDTSSCKENKTFLVSDRNIYDNGKRKSKKRSRNETNKEGKAKKGMKEKRAVRGPLLNGHFSQDSTSCTLQKTSKGPAETNMQDNNNGSKTVERVADVDDNEDVIESDENREEHDIGLRTDMHNIEDEVSRESPDNRKTDFTDSRYTLAAHIDYVSDPTETLTCVFCAFNTTSLNELTKHLDDHDIEEFSYNTDENMTDSYITDNIDFDESTDKHFERGKAIYHEAPTKYAFGDNEFTVTKEILTNSEYTTKELFSDSSCSDETTAESDQSRRDMDVDGNDVMPSNEPSNGDLHHTDVDPQPDEDEYCSDFNNDETVRCKRGDINMDDSKHVNGILAGVESLLESEGADDFLTRPFACARCRFKTGNLDYLRVHVEAHIFEIAGQIISRIG